MALILVFHNDSTGSDNTGNYDVQVYINQQLIEQGRVEQYSRSHGWAELVGQYLIQRDISYWSEKLLTPIAPRSGATVSQGSMKAVTRQHAHRQHPRAPTPRRRRIS